ncbi:DUF1294 domain-containing protein [Bacillus sp. 1P06AnD]|uniref:DUF1294 domain-containing protein n=1 Tax=Bacillus sp. 1P06AnD TaxID=3132208 RepID=UPI0039A28AF2
MEVIYVCIMSVIAFVLMGIDKSRARMNKRRISERTLWIVAWIGGAPGSVCGMKYFRHKTKHVQFRIGFPFLAVFQILIILYVAVL